MAVTVTLEQDEALVLFELLTSKKILQAVDRPEKNALCALQSLLEAQLEEPFKQDYKKSLDLARQSLLNRLGT